MYCEYGYTRKSTPKQSIDRQIRNIKALFPNTVIIQEKDFEGTLADNDVMKLTGLSRNTYYKYKREIKTGIQADCGL